MSNVILNKPISRRTVLRGIGTALSLPVLEAMSPTLASASTSVGGSFGRVEDRPLRMAFFFVPNGMHIPDWSQFGSGRQNQASSKEKTESLKITPLLKPLEKFKDQINVYSGLSLRGARSLGDGPGDHARSVAAFLTGAHPKKTDGKAIRNGISVDQIAAKTLGRYTKFPSLEVGTEPSAPAGRCDSGYSCVYTSNISWRSEVSPVAKEIDPMALFDRLFGTSNETASRDARVRNAKRRRSVLDLVNEETKQLHRSLGKTDQAKLDEYLYSIREIERRLTNIEKLDRTELDVPDYPRPEGIPRKYDEHVRLLLDMMVLAFQTDSTRVSSFMFANAGSNRSYRKIGVRAGHHDLSHHGNNKQKQKQISKINFFHVNLFKHFIDRLATIPDKQGSLLDNSIIVYGSGIADGNRHDHDRLPMMTVGGGGGRMVTGQHFALPDETPLTNLYLSLLQMADVSENGKRVQAFSDSNGVINGLMAN